MLEYVGYVSRGRVHKTNDDAAMLNHSVIHNGIFYGKTETDEGLFAVADGVGSVKHSELASREVLNCLRECEADQSERIRKRICEANENLIKFSRQYDYDRIISTTLCMVSIMESSIISYNLGNSRLYRFRGGYLRLLTKDHTKVQEMIDAGFMDIEFAKNYPDKGIITRFIGSENFSEEWIDITKRSESIESGDILMLCSDGIHDYIDIELLEEILSVDASLNELADVIIRCANDTGGCDNATVVLIRKIDYQLKEK